MAIWLIATPEEMATYELQTAKHGLKWNDGDMYESEFLKQLRKNVPKFNTHIFTFDKTVERYFRWNFRRRHSYNHVTSIKNILPIADDNIKCCSKNHASCSEKAVLEMAKAMRRALVPFYIPSLVYDHKKFFAECKKLADSDTNAIKAGEHTLKAPFYRTLNLVDLLTPQNDSQHSDQGECEIDEGPEIGSQRFMRADCLA
jgi:hypothetical protein